MNFGDSASTLNGRGLTIVLSTKEGGTAKKKFGNNCSITPNLIKTFSPNNTCVLCEKEGKCSTVKIDAMVCVWSRCSYACGDTFLVKCYVVWDCCPCEDLF